MFAGSIGVPAVNVDESKHSPTVNEPRGRPEVLDVVGVPLALTAPTEANGSGALELLVRARPFAPCPHAQSATSPSRAARRRRISSWQAAGG
jgi:hypothetical protein